MHVLKWFVTPFNLEVEHADIKSHLEDELVDMFVDFKVKSLFRIKSLRDFRAMFNIVIKYPKCSKWGILLAFPSLYMVEVGILEVDSIKRR